MKALIETIFGIYVPLVDSVTGSYVSGVAGLDWSYLSGVLLFAIVLYCFLRMIGVLLKW